ncbi:MAG: HPr family phosphocarrier protein [Pseudomonadota bacterium]
MTVVECRSTRIINAKGLHARASAKLAKLALTLPAKIQIRHESEVADARSIMDLLCLGAACGQIIEIHAEGEGAEQSVRAVVQLIEAGFGELADDAA